VGDIDKTLTQMATATVTISIKWKLADTEPAVPEGYLRFSTFDIDLGQLGKLWAFQKLPPS
jgi:hypothetical protein